MKGSGIFVEITSNLNIFFLEAILKILKSFVFVLLLTILISSVFMIPTQAQDSGLGYSAFLPLVFGKRTNYPSSFGLEFRPFSYDRLDQAVEAGNYWVRKNNLLWSEYQPDNQNQFIRNEVLEQNLAAVNAAGMETILIIRSTPEWAGLKYAGYYCGPMENIDAFANFLAEVVTRYSAFPYNVRYYELWNEPDNNWRHPSVGPTEAHGCWGDPDLPDFGGQYYGEMLKKVYPAIKNANPEAQVVIGGLLMPCDPIQHWYSDHCPMSYFLRGILRVGAGNAFDILNIHAYAHYNPAMSNMIQMEKSAINWWSDRGGEVEGKLNFVNEIMSQYGVSKPIIMTETGMLDYDNKYVNDSNLVAFENAKADYVVWLNARNLTRGIQSTNIYNDYDWNRTGLFNRSGEVLPAYESFKVMTQALGTASYTREVPYGFEFSRGGSRVWVLFSEDGTEKSIGTPAGFFRAYDLFGNPTNPIDGRIYFTRPIYVELN